MNIKKVLGGLFIFISMFLSIRNIFSSKITGAVIGNNLESSLIAVLTGMFFLMGLIFMSNLERRASSSRLVRAAAIAGTAVIMAMPSYNVIRENRNNLIENPKNKTEIKKSTPESTEGDKVEITGHWADTLGRFQRTYRWDRNLDEAEAKYGLPKGVLKGVIMKESYGDPTRVSGVEDGGAGLAMFQPGTAKDMGLRTYGKSNASGADTTHGRELKEIVKAHNYNYEELAEIDERFDIKKSVDAAAKYLKRNYDKYGSWDKAILAYNQGGKYLKNASETKYVKDVNAYAKYYNKKDEKDKKYYRKLDRLKKRESKKDSRKRR